MIHIWRLSEAGEDNLGLAIDHEGLVLGRTPLIERRNGSFATRDRGEIEQLLSSAYKRPAAVDRLMPRLTAIASALSAGDYCLAHLAALHLQLPDLPDRIARAAMEAADALIRTATIGSGNEIGKASPDE